VSVGQLQDGRGRWTLSAERGAAFGRSRSARNTPVWETRNFCQSTAPEFGTASVSIMLVLLAVVFIVVVAMGALRELLLVSMKRPLMKTETGRRQHQKKTPWLCGRPQQKAGDGVGDDRPRRRRSPGGDGTKVCLKTDSREDRGAGWGFRGYRRPPKGDRTGRASSTTTSSFNSGCFRIDGTSTDSETVG
jgi:hypothetical protein